MNYQARNSLLQELGYSSYAEYLASPLWSSIRARVYAAKGRTCIRCKIRPATEIHHISYGKAALTGFSLNCLVPVCRECHESEHFLARGGSRKANRKKTMARSPRPSAELNRCILCGNETTLTGACGPCKRMSVAAAASVETIRYWCQCGNRRASTRQECRSCSRKRLATIVNQ